MSNKSNHNLDTFRAFLEQCDTVPAAETFVREIITGAAESAPIHVIKRIGETIAACQEEDLKKEAEAN